jgi:putative phage-type endonuclease
MVNEVHVEQRSAAWHAHRKGRITGSLVAAAVGISRYKSRKKWWREMRGLEPPFEGNPATEWGSKWEDAAISAYEEVTGNLVSSSGFMTRKGDAWWGASLDGKVGDDGIIEAKCPHRRTLYADIAPWYMAQCQSNMLVSGRSWCDYFCYVPPEDHDGNEAEGGIRVWRVEASKEYQEVLDGLVRKAFARFVLKIPPAHLKDRMLPDTWEELDPSDRLEYLLADEVPYGTKVGGRPEMPEVSYEVTHEEVWEPED